MKKIAKLIVATALMLAPLAAAPAAMAATYTCPSGYILQTGPDSKNICVSKEKLVCEVVNNNTVTIDSGNDQLSISGDGLGLDNTQVGDSTSGSATNTNNESFVVTVTNGGEDGNVCVAARTVKPTEKPEQGAGAVTTPKEEAPTVLPNTSSDLVSTILTTAAVTLGLGAAGLFLGVTAYRLFQTK